MTKLPCVCRPRSEASCLCKYDNEAGRAYWTAGRSKPELPCPHCPDGHTPPDGGSQPWAAYVHSDRDGDGQPTHIIVARSAGAHVSESDAQWVRDVLNGRTDRHGRPIPRFW